MCQLANHDESNLAQLSCLCERLEGGGPVKVAVLGGSVSAGTSMRIRSGLYHSKFERFLKETWVTPPYLIRGPASRSLSVCR